MAVRQFAATALLVLACTIPTVECGIDRPLEKIMELLTNLQSKLKGDAASDLETWEKKSCYCKTTDKELSTQIEGCKGEMDALKPVIEEGTVLSATLGSEIKALNADITKSEAALSKAAAIYEKEKTTYEAEDEDLTSSIAALSGAIKALSEHHGAFLQTDVSAQLQKLAPVLKRRSTDEKLKKSIAFLTHNQKEPVDYFSKTPTFKGSYAPESGEVYGMLIQMKETFESDKAEAKTEFEDSEKAYYDLKAAKEAEISAAEEFVDKKTTTLADSDKKVAEAKTSLKDETEALAAAEATLLGLKKECKAADESYELLKADRAEELRVVGQVIKMLSSPWARDLLERTTAKPVAFVERESALKSQRIAASRMLNRLGLHSLAAETLRMKENPFEKVNGKIDEMITELKDQARSEIIQKNECQKDLNENEVKALKLANAKTTLESEMTAVLKSIGDLKTSIAAEEAVITTARANLDKSAKTRETEASAFATGSHDIKEATMLLENVILYMNNEATWAEKPEYSGLKQVRAALIIVKDDLLKEKKDMIEAEDKAKTAYSDTIAELDKDIAAAQEIIRNKQKTLSEDEEKEFKLKKDISDNTADASINADIAKQLHMQCDFLLKNFEVRQENFNKEIAGLRNAQHLLAGVN